MNLIVQPADGTAPLIAAIRQARQTVEIMVFRFDLKEVQKALETAVARGVRVHALIANTNSGGGKRLRKLERDLLAAGVTVSRTGDDLVRYHGKMLIVDRRVLVTLGFNCTHLDTEKSRAIAVVTRHHRLVREAVKLFEADSSRQPYTAGCEDFLVSPENARVRLAKFIKSARKQLLVYDIKANDREMLRLLHERAAAGLDVRIIGKVSKKDGLQVEKMPKLRLHLRATLRDGRDLFTGSQSLRALELDRRREIGVIVRDRDVSKRFKELFEADWAETDSGRKAQKHAEGTSKDESEKSDESKKIA